MRVKNVNKTIRAVKKVFKDTKRSKKLQKEIGQETLFRILFETRRGNTMAGGVKRKLPELKPITKDIRKAISKNASELVDPQFFKPNKANNTLTGQLLNSLKWVIKGNSVFILISGRRNRIDFQGVKSKLSKTKSGKIRNTKSNRRSSFGLDFAGSDQATTNSEVYNDLVKLGRDFIGLDEKGQKALRKLVLDEFRRRIK